MESVRVIFMLCVWWTGTPYGNERNRNETKRSSRSSSEKKTNWKYTRTKRIENSCDMLYSAQWAIEVATRTHFPWKKPESHPCSVWTEQCVETVDSFVLGSTTLDHSPCINIDVLICKRWRNGVVCALTSLLCCMGIGQYWCRCHWRATSTHLKCKWMTEKKFHHRAKRQ